jgi:hypothetical protein
MIGRSAARWWYWKGIPNEWCDVRVGAGKQCQGGRAKGGNSFAAQGVFDSMDRLGFVLFLTRRAVAVFGDSDRRSKGNEYRPNFFRQSASGELTLCVQAQGLFIFQVAVGERPCGQSLPKS